MWRGLGANIAIVDIVSIVSVVQYELQVASSPGSRVCVLLSLSSD